MFNIAKVQVDNNQREFNNYLKTEHHEHNKKLLKNRISVKEKFEQSSLLLMALSLYIYIYIYIYICY